MADGSIQIGPITRPAYVLHYDAAITLVSLAAALADDDAPADGKKRKAVRKGGGDHLVRYHWAALGLVTRVVRMSDYGYQAADIEEMGSAAFDAFVGDLRTVAPTASMPEIMADIGRAAGDAWERVMARIPTASGVAAKADAPPS